MLNNWLTCGNVKMTTATVNTTRTTVEQKLFVRLADSPVEIVTEYMPTVPRQLLVVAGTIRLLQRDQTLKVAKHVLMNFLNVCTTNTGVTIQMQEK